MRATPLALAAGLALAGPRAPAQAAPPGPGSEPPSSAAATPRGRVETVAISVTGLDEAALRHDLALRLPDLRLVTFAGADPGAPGFGYWEVRYRPESQAVVTRLILSDGRSYRREATAPPERAPRLAASLLANLLPAIEQDRAVPDEVGVALPSGTEAEPARGPEAEPAPAREEPGEAELERAAAPEGPPPPWTRRSAGPAPWGIGLPVSGALAAGLGPPTDLQGLAAGTIDLSMWARSRAGGTVLLGVRGGWRQNGPFVMERGRLSVGGGYVWRGRWLELPVLAAATLEWWRVRKGGRVQSVVGPSGDPSGRSPLLGGLLAFAPGAVWWPRRGRVGLRLGAVVELAASGVPRAGIIRVVERKGGRDQERLRAGGLELSVGLSLGVWIPVRPRERHPIRTGRPGAGPGGSG